MIRAALLAIGSLAAAVMITAVAYFAFSSPIALLLPGALIIDHIWPAPAPPELVIARMLAVNVLVITAIIAALVIAVAALRNHNTKSNPRGNS